MTTLSVTPDFPIPGQQTQVVFTLTESGSNFLRVWCVAAPDGTPLDVELKKNAQNRTEIYTGDAGDKHSWAKTFDKGGAYQLVAQEYKKGGNFRGGYQGDPRGARAETKVGGETALTLFVGERLETKIGVGPDTATLVYYMWADRIRATDLKSYGIKTPAIVNARPSSKAKLAMASVNENVSGRNSLANIAAAPDSATLIGDPFTIITNLVFIFDIHIQLTSVHVTAETDNLPKPEIASPVAPKDLPTQVNELLRVWRRHFLNDNGGGIGSTGVSPYHLAADFVDAPLYTSASTLEEAYAAIADLWRALKKHIGDSTVYHTGSAELTLDPLSPLLIVHLDYLSVLASLNVTPPAAAPSGSATAVAMTGAKVV